MPTPKFSGANTLPASAALSLATHFPSSLSQTSPTAIGLIFPLGFRSATSLEAVHIVGSPPSPRSTWLKKSKMAPHTGESSPRATCLMSSKVQGDIAAADMEGRPWMPSSSCL